MSWQWIVGLCLGGLVVSYVVFRFQELEGRVQRLEQDRRTGP